jgi:hypothetical protein
VTKHLASPYIKAIVLLEYLHDLAGSQMKF